uniref:Uncharacterized protein n=1 Tax=Leersia perrieri TaxID=77586 RepID=A0A0D9XZ99_9ORYZ
MKIQAGDCVSIIVAAACSIIVAGEVASSAVADSTKSGAPDGQNNPGRRLAAAEACARRP